MSDSATLTTKDLTKIFQLSSKLESLVTKSYFEDVMEKYFGRNGEKYFGRNGEKPDSKMEEMVIVEDLVPNPIGNSSIPSTEEEGVSIVEELSLNSINESSIPSTEEDEDEFELIIPSLFFLEAEDYELTIPSFFFEDIVEAEMDFTRLCHFKLAIHFCEKLGRLKEFILIHRKLSGPDYSSLHFDYNRALFDRGKIAAISSITSEKWIIQLMSRFVYESKLIVLLSINHAEITNEWNLFGNTFKRIAKNIRLLLWRTRENVIGYVSIFIGLLGFPSSSVPHNTSIESAAMIFHDSVVVFYLLFVYTYTLFDRGKRSDGSILAEKYSGKSVHEFLPAYSDVFSTVKIGVGPDGSTWIMQMAHEESDYKPQISIECKFSRNADFFCAQEMKIMCNYYIHISSMKLHLCAGNTMDILILLAKGFKHNKGFLLLDIAAIVSWGFSTGQHKSFLNFVLLPANDHGSQFGALIRASYIPARMCSLLPTPLPYGSLAIQKVHMQLVISLWWSLNGVATDVLLQLIHFVPQVLKWVDYLKWKFKLLPTDFGCVKSATGMLSFIFDAHVEEEGNNKRNLLVLTTMRNQFYFSRTGLVLLFSWLSYAVCGNLVIQEDCAQLQFVVEWMFLLLKEGVNCIGNRLRFDVGFTPVHNEAFTAAIGWDTQAVNTQYVPSCCKQIIGLYNHHFTGYLTPGSDQGGRLVYSAQDNHSLSGILVKIVDIFLTSAEVRFPVHLQLVKSLTAKRNGWLFLHSTGNSETFVSGRLLFDRGKAYSMPSLELEEGMYVGRHVGRHNENIQLLEYEVLRHLAGLLMVSFSWSLGCTIRVSWLGRKENFLLQLNCGFIEEIDAFPFLSTSTFVKEVYTGSLRYSPTLLQLLVFLKWKTTWFVWDLRSEETVILQVVVEVGILTVWLAYRRWKFKFLSPKLWLGGVRSVSCTNMDFTSTICLETTCYCNLICETEVYKHTAASFLSKTSWNFATACLMLINGINEGICGTLTFGILPSECKGNKTNADISCGTDQAGSWAENGVACVLEAGTRESSFGANFGQETATKYIFAENWTLVDGPGLDVVLLGLTGVVICHCVNGLLVHIRESYTHYRDNQFEGGVL